MKVLADNLCPWDETSTPLTAKIKTAIYEYIADEYENDADVQELLNKAMLLDPRWKSLFINQELMDELKDSIIDEGMVKFILREAKSKHWSCVLIGMRMQLQFVVKPKLGRVKLLACVDLGFVVLTQIIKPLITEKSCC